MVIRDKFDEYFFNKTIEMGVDFKKINKIKEITILEREYAPVK